MIDKKLKALEKMSDIFSEIMHAHVMKKKSKSEEPKEEDESEEHEASEAKEEVKAPSWMNKVKAPEKKG